MKKILHLDDEDQEFIVYEQDNCLGLYCQTAYDDKVFTITLPYVQELIATLATWAMTHGGIIQTKRIKEHGDTKD